MNKFYYSTLFIFFFISLKGICQNQIDVIYLNNGNIVKGLIIENRPNDYIKIELPGGSVFNFKYSDILLISKEQSSYSTSQKDVNPEKVNYENGGKNNIQNYPENNFLGLCLGLSFLGSTVQLGINYEHLMQVENFGTMGIGGVFRYWSYSEDYFYKEYGYYGANLKGEWSYTNVLIGAQGNYHFAVNNDKFDPWIGLVLAYNAASVNWNGPSAGNNFIKPVYGGVFLGLHGGLRYWLSPNLALTGRLGFGTLSYGGLEVGVDFRL
jgi:hypothetical protein